MLSTRSSAYAQPRFFFFWMSFYQSHIASLLTPIATRTVVHQIISLLSALTITPNYPAKTNSVRITQIDTVCPNPVIVPPVLRLNRHRILSSQTIQSKGPATFWNPTNSRALPIPAFAACVATTRIDWAEKIADLLRMRGALCYKSPEIQRGLHCADASQSHSNKRRPMVPARAGQQASDILRHRKQSGRDRRGGFGVLTSCARAPRGRGYPVAASKAALT